MYCTECGLKIDGRFCANCGAPVQGTEREQITKVTKIVTAGAIILVALIVGIVVLAKDSGPEGTVKNFFYAIEKGDFDRFVSTIDPLFLNELGESSVFWKQEMKDLLERTSSWMWIEREIEIRILDSTIVGSNAEVTVQIRSRDDIGNDIFYLSKRENKWYIDYEHSGLGGLLILLFY